MNLEGIKPSHIDTNANTPLSLSGIIAKKFYKEIKITKS